jgi:hypothetical protein
LAYEHDDLVLARRHVVEADARILRQRDLIERLAGRDQPTGLARDLLANLEDTVVQMRVHLVAIAADLGEPAQEA